MTVTQRVLSGCPSRGFALILVLWALALLSVIAGSFAFSMRVETELVTHLVDSARAKALAQAGVQLGIMDLFRPDDDAARWRTDGTVYEVPFAGGRIRVAIASETGKIDLNAAPDALIEGLLASLGKGQDGAELADAILDWRDRDQERRPQGAEDRDYLASGLPYRARDDSFLTVEELDQVLGMHEEVYRRLMPVVTVYSRAAKLDPMTASREALLAIPGLEPVRVDEFLAARGQSVGLGVQPPLDLLEAGRAFLNPSRGSVYTVDAVAEVSGVRARQRAVVKITGNPKQPYSVLAWLEGESEGKAGPLGLGASEGQ